MSIIIIYLISGSWNVRADLDNFVILLMPTQTVASSSSPSLLDFLTKSIPRRKKTKYVKKQHSDGNAAQETMHHFIESKSAPYQVDISKTKSALEIESSPSSVRVKNIARNPKVFILTVPVEGDENQNITTEEFDMNTEETNSNKELLLLGSQEQCGPGLFRDVSGICRLRNLV